jgi:transcriptional regulator GlxA family with amidase domain
MESTPPLLLGVLVYPGVQQAAVLGLADLFAVAERLDRAAFPASRPLHVRLLTAEAGVPVWPDPPLAALLLPPALGPGAPPPADPALVAWIRARHGEGTLVASVCAGTFLLAETGLLDHRPATTHWALAEAFRARFPRVALDTDRLVIEDGDLMTAGGLMAWVDLGLRLIHRFLGQGALLATARHFLVDPGGREQRFYSTFAPVLTHGDGAILRIQHWLQGDGATGASVPEMAARCAMSERTFLRRFRKATGLAPSEYLQRLRVGRAKDLLERTDLGLEEVAWRVGYGDPAAFRKVFLRIAGLSPADHRRRFRIPGA